MMIASNEAILMCAYILHFHDKTRQLPATFFYFCFFLVFYFSGKYFVGLKNEVIRNDERGIDVQNIEDLLYNLKHQIK